MHKIGDERVYISIQIMYLAEMIIASSLVNDPEFADMTIICGDRVTLHAHRAIVCESLKSLQRVKLRIQANALSGSTRR